MEAPLDCCDEWQRARFGRGSSPLAAARVRHGWKDCCCRWLLLDLLAISRMLCSVAVSGVMLLTLPDLAEREKKQAWPYTLCSPPGLLAAGPAGVVQEERLLLLLRNATAAGPLLDICACWIVLVCSLRPSPPTSGLARMRGGGVRSWTGSLLSTPLAADCGPGPEPLDRRPSYARSLVSTPSKTVGQTLPP